MEADRSRERSASFAARDARGATGLMAMAGTCGGLRLELARGSAGQGRRGLPRGRGGGGQPRRDRERFSLQIVRMGE